MIIEKKSAIIFILGIIMVITSVTIPTTILSSSSVVEVGKEKKMIIVGKIITMIMIINYQNMIYKVYVVPQKTMRRIKSNVINFMICSKKE